MGKNTPTADVDGAAKRGLQLEPEYEEMVLSFDLKCKKSKKEKDKEVWLLQVPIDFPLGEDSTWQLREGNNGASVLACDIDGAEYFMEDDNSLGNTAVYAIEGNDASAATKIDRRLAIYRTTAAPKLCFGLEPSEMAPEVEDLRVPKRNSKAAGKSEDPGKSKDSSKKKKRGGDEDKEDKKKKKKDKKEKK